MKTPKKKFIESEIVDPETAAKADAIFKRRKERLSKLSSKDTDPLKTNNISRIITIFCFIVGFIIGSWIFSPFLLKLFSH
ncbi:MAG: hypothetical protein WCW87_04330 [Candidatus Paceibacterota bacterium]